MVRRIEVVPHDPAWARAFRQEAEALRLLLGEETLAIHHIGSTAIPGIVAKPILDILVVVRDIAAIDALNPSMIARGYRPRGEKGISGRRYFIKGEDEHRSHHVHMFQASDPNIQRHLAFRDYLIAHPEDARAYGALKQELAARFPEDAGRYSDGKQAFVQGIEQAARAWRGGIEEEGLMRPV